MSPGIRTRFDQELADLEERLLELGSRARQNIAFGVRSFIDNDVELARQVVGLDASINDLRWEIEEKCLSILAREQPVAGDLRLVISGLVMANEFERMADHGKKLARICIRTTQEPRTIPSGDIERLSELVLEMYDRALRAIASRDVEEAHALCKLDDGVDAHYKQLFNVTLSYMLENPRAIGPGTYRIQVGHELERIGDRVTNIAERLIYAVTGELEDLNA